MTNQTLTNCSDLENYSDITLGKQTGKVNIIMHLHALHLESPFPVLRKTLISASVVIVSICLFRLFTELTQVIANPKDYLTEFLNYAELFLYLSTIAFVCNGTFTCLNGWRWQLGAVCIFLSWLNFAFFLRLQPQFGIYVIMFEEIIATFLKVLPLALLLIFAFGQPFFILLSPITIESDVSDIQ